MARALAAILSQVNSFELLSADFVSQRDPKVVSMKCVVFWPRHPRPQKKHLANKNTSGSTVYCTQLYLRSNKKLKSNYPSDPGRNQAKPVELRRTMAVRSLPQEGAAKIKTQSVPKYSWLYTGRIRPIYESVTLSTLGG
jgi:hypothetical protein